MRTKRLMIEIDEERCDGCGLCIPSCHEGALQIIDGKAKLVAERLCDGLGACLGHCPQDALKVVEQWVEPFEAPPTLDAAGAAVHAAAVPPAAAPATPALQAAPAGGCPGSRMRMLHPQGEGDAAGEPEASRLAHWPVQIRLIPPHAPFLQDADLVVAADCVPVALPDFHRRWVDGKAVMIGCPKFDDLEEYTARFTALFAQASIRSVTVLVMEVPCCQSLPVAVLRGMEAAGRKVPAEVVVVGVDGEIRMRRRP